MLYNDILQQVTKPARYTGGEWNSIVKDWDKATIRVALSFPDVYEIGMSNIALPILYKMLNSQPDTLAERVYAPWVDMAEALRAAKIPLFSLESKRPLRDFDIIGFSLGYELSYTNVLNMLDLAQLPVLAAERDEACPLIIAGGSCALNPEPMSDFIDVFFIGECEELLPEFMACFREWKESGGAAREELLRRAAAIPGIYVPRFYRAEYHPDGRLKSFTPSAAEASPVIERRLVGELPPPVTDPVVPFIETVHDRGAIEVQRGCSCGCRFCQAGMIYRPVRERPHEEVIGAAGELISNCGYDEVSLVSLNTSDYSGINELVPELSRQYPHTALSLPSLRLDSFSVKLMASLPGRSKTGLTFAPEAGSQRLRRVINKNIPEERLVEAATAAFERGWTGLKLYFMLGLPTETEDDVAEIVNMVERVRALGRATSRRTPQIRVSIATFVPKAHTPFQWVAQENEESINAKQEILRQGLRHKSIRLSWNDTKTSLLEAVFSRGDRRLGRVIYEAWRQGCTFDAWSERFDADKWVNAFAGAGLDPFFYARRERALDELLPWSHINTGVTDRFLRQEFQRALEGAETPDCRFETCNACGLQRYHPACRQKSKS